MNFDCDVSIKPHVPYSVRKDFVRNALALCGHTPSEEDVTGILRDLATLYGTSEDRDAEVVGAVDAEYLDSYFKRALNERNREKFADELAARVRETVKQMTWYTEDQKVIPEDLAVRVAQKRIDEENTLAALREKLSRW